DLHASTRRQRQMCIRDRGASFAITRRSDNTIGISARSMGKINVQIIMEKLGGGGHLSNAATQIKDVTIEEAKQKLLDAIDEYEKEND
ncbi:MAG: DHHA1 domain-containing protein, partial [Lactobacillus crispatus]|nr:DHHA1 domain-containing protein [Lactobacillus crispatus]